jgi:uncharacterized membrane protein
MLNRVLKTKYSSLDWFYVFLIFILAFTIILRCIYLDKRVYWGDEIVTSIRISGYNIYQNLVNEFANRSNLSVADLMAYQDFSISKGVDATIQGLIAEEPQHTPIYFVALHFWVMLFKDLSNPIVVARSFSVFLSLLALLCLYWLGFELFGSVTSGLIAIAMMAASPFYFVYAQEARPVIIWILSILISSVLFLRALRLNTRFAWFIYATAVTLSLYTYLFSVFILIGHGIYILLIKGLKVNKFIIRYLITCAVSLSAFIPWLIETISNISALNSGTNWASNKLGSFSLIKFVLLNVRDLFFNVGGGHNYLTFLLFILIIFSLYFLIHHSPKSMWAFVFSLMIVTIVIVLVPDILHGGLQRSAASRYFIAPYLGINLSLTYLFSVQIKKSFLGWKRFWKLILSCLLIIGTVSCFAISQAEVSFDQATYRNSKILATIINKYEKPQIISSTAYGNNLIGMIALSHYIRSDTKFNFVTSSNKINISSIPGNIFIYGKDMEFISKDSSMHFESLFPNKYENLLYLKKDLSTGYRTRIEEIVESHPHEWKRD